MQYRTLGRTGIEVSLLGFGCGANGGLFVKGTPADQHAAVARALEGGVTYFDTAAAYGDGLSEQNLGRVLRDLRVDPIVGTKVRVQRHETSQTTAILRSRLEEGLRRLGRESVDVCTFHGQIGEGLEHDVNDVCGPIAEAMTGLVDVGLCRAIGFSGMGDPDATITILQSGAFDYFQCVYSLSNPSAEEVRGKVEVVEDYGGVLAKAHEMDAGVMCIRVLASGVLSGKLKPHPVSGHTKDGPDVDRHAAIARALQPVASEFGFGSESEIAIAFVLSNQDVSTALVGFSDEQQVSSALNAVERAPLAPGLFDRLRHELL